MEVFKPKGTGNESPDNVSTSRHIKSSRPANVFKVTGNVVGRVDDVIEEKKQKLTVKVARIPDDLMKASLELNKKAEADSAEAKKKANLEDGKRKAAAQIAIEKAEDAKKKKEDILRAKKAAADKKKRAQKK